MEYNSFVLVIVLIVLCQYYIERKDKNCACVKFKKVDSKGELSFSIHVSTYDILAIINTIVEICMEIQ